MDLKTTRTPERPYSLDEAFQHCAEITNAHYENFPVASLFLPEEKRPFIQAIYAFSRIADDFADEGALTAQERLARLEEWEQMLVECYAGSAVHPVFIALAETVKQLAIPIEPLKDLLKAFKQDVVQNRYETFDELLGYCACSANPVGRLVLLIFGYRSDELFKLSDNICTALQLANFWQDISVDVKKDRLYIPLEDMKRFSVSLEEWKNQSAGKNFQSLIRFEAERTKQLFYAGSELPALVDRDLQLELKLVWLGGMSIIKKIERKRYNVLTSRPRLSTSNKIMILVKGLLINNISRYGRKKPQWDLT